MVSETEFALRILSTIALILPALIILRESLPQNRRYEIRLADGALISFLILSIAATFISSATLVLLLPDASMLIQASVVVFVVGLVPVIVTSTYYLIVKYLG